MAPKILRFVASAKVDLSEMPEDVKYEVGSSLWQIQCGETPANSKQLKGTLKSVREIFVSDGGDAYRTIYTTKIADIVYVLDAFKKKSKKGAETPQRDLDRIEHRLKMAKEQHEKGKH